MGWVTFSRKKLIKVPKTLASRLTLWYGAIFVVFSGTAFLFFYLSIDSILNKRIDEDLEEDISEFRMLLSSEGIERVESEIEREAMSEDPKEVFLRLLDRDGNQIIASDLSHWEGLEMGANAPKAVATSAEPVFRTVTTAQGEHDARIISGFIGAGIILQIGESMEDKEEFMEMLLNIFATTFIVVIGLAALAGWFMARQALRGVEEVSRAAVDVANGTLDRRVSVKAKSEEIERLVATFNVMVDRIRGLILGMREMTDNIAHDLRSPLARIRANAEMALSRAKTMDEHKTAQADTLEECDRLLQMINTTLDVAEAEVGAAEFAKEDVDISKIVHDACELFEPIAEDKEIELSVALETNCRINGHTQYLQRMLANLLDNALKYTQPKGTVGVELSSDKRAVSISIRDTGVGIGQADQSRIFDRFFRCDQSRSLPGCGLGLSLARAVARAHDGDITLSSAPGRGSVFTVTLPV